MLVDAPIVNLSAEQALRLSSLRPGLLIDVQVATTRQTDTYSEKKQLL